MSRLFSYIENNKRGLVRLTRQLIQIPTQNPPGENYERLVALLEKRCRAAGLNVKKILLPLQELRKAGIKDGSGRIILLASLKTGAKKTLHMNAHYDVVPATSNWRYGPFEARVQRGKIFGRGAEDDKGNIACMLFAVESAIKCKVSSKVNMELSFTPDEETGGDTGFGYLVKNNLISPDYAIGEGHPRDYASFGNKGILWAEVVVSGKSAHASEPYRGVNAFEKMLAVADEFMKLKRGVERRKTSYKTLDPRDRYATFEMGGVVRGGSKINTLPDKVSFTIDRRVLPDEDFDDALKEMRETISRLKKKDPALKIKLYIKTKEKPVVSKSDSPLAKEVSRAIALVYGRPAKFAITSGGTDMRYLIRRGVECVGYSAAGGARWHSDNEFVYIDSLVATTKVFAHILSNLS